MDDDRMLFCTAAPTRELEEINVKFNGPDVKEGVQGIKVKNIELNAII